MIAMDAEQGVYVRFSESEKLGKLFFQILNFHDSKAWIAEDLRVTIPEGPRFKSWLRYQIKQWGYGPKP
jgi:hypothetical protein